LGVHRRDLDVPQLDLEAPGCAPKLDAGH
jgi:hypothetical protein